MAAVSGSAKVRKRRDESQHGSVEGAVDLRERGGAGIIHVHHRQRDAQNLQPSEQLGHH